MGLVTGRHSQFVYFLGTRRIAAWECSEIEVLQDVTDRRKTVSIEDPLELGIRRAESDAMAESIQRADTIDTRLLWIDFPGMHVEHGWDAIRSGTVDGHLRHLSGGQPEVTAADGNPDGSGFPYCWRILVDREFVSCMLVDGRSGFWNPISIAFHRENARVQGKSMLVQDVDRPQGCLCYRKAWGAKKMNLDSSRLLDGMLCVNQVLFEFLWCHLIDEAMPVGVTTQFMACIDDATDQLRITIGDPSENKKGSANMFLLKEFEQPIRVGFHTARKGIPCSGRDPVGKTRDMEVIFDIHGECVGDVGWECGVVGRLWTARLRQPHHASSHATYLVIEDKRLGEFLAVSFR